MGVRVVCLDWGGIVSLWPETDEEVNIYPKTIQEEAEIERKLQNIWRGINVFFHLPSAAEGLTD